MCFIYGKYLTVNDIYFLNSFNSKKNLWEDWEFINSPIYLNSFVFV